MSAVPLLPFTLGDVLNAARRTLGPNFTAEAEAQVRRFAKGFLDDLKHLAKSRRAGPRRRVRGRAFMVEHSYAARFCCFLLGYPRGAKILTLAKLHDRAGKVYLRRPSGETVSVEVQAKADGGYRLITKRGPLDRAANFLADTLLRIIWGESDYEFARKGRGRDAAVRGALHSYRHGGVRQFVVADLKDFYGSINKEALPDIVPLPKSIIQHTLTISDETKIKLIHDNTNGIHVIHPDSHAVRAGIPQGSRASSLIASKLIEPVLAALNARFAASHGDDLLIGVRDMAERDSTKSALGLAFASHPAGPLPVKRLEGFGLTEGHDYLGYQFVRRRRFYGGYAKAKASEKAENRLRQRMARQLALMPMKEHESYMWTRCHRWAAACGACDATPEDVAFYAYIRAEDLLTPLLLAWREAASAMKFASFAEAQATFEEHWQPHLEPWAWKDVQKFASKFWPAKV